MHKLILILIASGSIVSAQRPSPDFARLPGPVLRVADSLTIDADKAKLEGALTVFPGPRGGLIVYSQWATVTAFDSTGRRMWGHTPKERRELGEVSAFGWRGTEMWVSDASYEQIAMLDQYGNVTKSLEFPSWIRPTFSNRKTFPVFESMRVFALHNDGSLLVHPRSPVSTGAATVYDQTMTHILRVNGDGVIQQTIAKFPTNIISGKDARGDFTFANPVNQSLFRVSPDGMRTVVVGVDTASSRTDTVVVRAMNDRGDTVYTRKFAYPAAGLTDAQVDSIARHQWGNNADFRTRRVKVMPRRAPAVIALALDVDKSLWLTLRGDGRSNTVIGIDAAGNYIGKFPVRSGRAVKAANMGRVWIGEARPDARGNLVRYRLVK